jgi:hypothetical protein
MLADSDVLLEDDDDADWELDTLALASTQVAE